MKKINKEPVFKEKKHCSHCGGVMRYYRGSYSCLMCGREADHLCENCLYVGQYIKRSA